MVDVVFDYSLLIDLINKNYEGSTLATKITKFCKDIEMKLYRFKRILEGKGYFQTDEIVRSKNILKLSDKETKECFLKSK